MGALKTKELSYDELNALTLRLFRELEVAHESMETMYARVRDQLKEMKERSKDEKMSNAEDRKAYARAAYALQGLFDRYNDFPTKNRMLHTFMTKAKANFRDTAAQQWVRLEKFLSITNMDNVYRDLVTDERIEHLDVWLDADKQEEHVFNETRLYDALGKDDARMVLAFWRRFHEVLILRRKIDHEDDETTPQIDPKEVIFRFQESELFQKMENLLSFSKNLLPKLIVNPKEADKHTEPQHKNLQRQLGEFFERLKFHKPKEKS